MKKHLVWALIPLALLLGGGIWGGVIQHTHNDANGGGSLIGNYAKLITQNTTLASINNSIANTTLDTQTIPANFIGSNRRITYRAFLDIDQETGGAVNYPTFTCDFGGGFSYALTPSGSVPFATTIPVLFECTVVSAGSAANTKVMASVRVGNGATAGASTVDVLVGMIPGPNMTTDKTLSLKVANGSANVNYTTTFHYAVSEVS